MSPLIQQNEIIFVNRIAYLFLKPKINDVIIFKDPRTGNEVIKRITKIQNNSYFVEGDNKNESTDSRHYGFIVKSQVIGKLLKLT